MHGNELNEDKQIHKEMVCNQPRDTLSAFDTGPETAKAQSPAQLAPAPPMQAQEDTER